MQLFKLIWYDTPEKNRYAADSKDIYEFLGNLNSIWRMWYMLKHEKRALDVDIVSTNGILQKPECAIRGLTI